jgi:hypothetical protein
MIEDVPDYEEEIREVHPLKSIGCFIRKPITAEQLLRRIREELE